MGGKKILHQDCCLGLEIRRTWSEQELVRSFGGQMPPGTPDGDLDLTFKGNW